MSSFERTHLAYQLEQLPAQLVDQLAELRMKQHVEKAVPAAQ